MAADPTATRPPADGPAPQPGSGRSDPAAAPRYRAVVVPHTHWDREWYEPFEVFRVRLVDVVDELLRLLRDDPRYDRFMLDGQAVVLEDYLAIRPERAADIRALVEAGKLAIGPWYVLADEFLASPEALIRNLARGRRICAALGGAMPYAYTPDSFGHVSQLPLLAAGFGLDAVVFERGVGDEGERLRGEFRWVAADGATELFAVHLLGTYSSAAGLGHADWELRDPFAVRRAEDQLRAALFGTSGVDLSELVPWLCTSFAHVPGGMAAYATTEHLLLLNGSDHLFPQPDLVGILAAVAPALPQVEFEVGLLGDYLEAARRPLEQLASFQGEFRSSRYHHCLYGVLSARLPLKQANHQAQVLLERYAEPVAALAWAATGAHPTALLDEAWRVLLLNHPHDSLCGCSVDAVHEEMATRFARVRQLGAALVRRGLTALSGDAGEPGVTVFNPLPRRRLEPVLHRLDLPPGEGAGVLVRDAAGHAVPAQVEVEQRFAPGSSERRVDRTTVRFLADVAGLGVAGYRFERGAAAAPDAAPAAAGAMGPEGRTRGTAATAATPGGASAGDPTAGAPGATADGRTLENEHLRVTFAEGELRLHDKRTGRTRPLGLRFEDGADRGDAYDFSALPGDPLVVADRPLEPPTVLAAGPVRAAWSLRYDPVVPAGLAEDRRARVGSVGLPLRVELSLAAGEAMLGVTVELDNVAEDHRLRLLVRTFRAADEVWADGHFDVLRRPLRPPAGYGWRQPPAATSHQRRFVLAADADGGLAVLNRGLPEYEALPGADGVELAITLLRCFGWLSRDDLPERRLESAGPERATPGGQCPGRQRFELALVPFAGAWWEGGVLEAAQAFTAPLYVQPVEHPATARGWLELEGADAATPIELSCLKRADRGGGWTLRVWNPAPVAARAVLRFAPPVTEVFEAELSEERRGRAAWEAGGPPGPEPVAEGAEDRETPRGRLPLALGPKQVRTFELVLGGGGNV